MKLRLGLLLITFTFSVTGPRARAVEAGVPCEAMFRGLHSSAAAEDDDYVAGSALQRLNFYRLSSQPVALRSGHSPKVNDVIVRDGQGKVRFGDAGIINQHWRNLVLEAASHGEIRDINIRELRDPSDLVYLLQIQSSAPVDRPIRITGHVSPEDLIKLHEANPVLTPGFSDAVTRLKLREGCVSVWKITDITKCGLMFFELQTDRLNEIRWKWQRRRGT